MISMFTATASAAVLALLLASSVSAQEIPSSVGLKGGLNLGHFTGDDADIEDTDTEFRLGYNVGLFTEIGLHPIFSLQPEIQFTQKGETVEAGGTVANGTWDVELAYLEIPVLAKVYFPTNTDTKPFVYAGPFLGFNLSAETDEVYEVVGFNFTSDSNLDEETNSWESGIAIGAGVTRFLSQGVILFDVRYTLGLTPTFDNDTFEEVYTGTIAAQLGYGFQLNR